MDRDLEKLDDWAFDTMSATLDTLPPPSALRARLMAAATGPAKFLPHCAALSKIFDLDVERMKALLAAIDEPGRWTPGIEPIQGFMHFRPGPSLHDLHGGFARMRHGTVFPKHRHKQREVTYVLDGVLVDDRGESRGPGSAFEMAAGSVHNVTVAGDGDCLVALLHGGIEMVGT